MSLKHTYSYLEMVVIAVICILYVHVQKADLNVGASIHGDGPAVVGTVWIGSWVERGGYLTRIPGQVIPKHWQTTRKTSIHQKDQRECV